MTKCTVYELKTTLQNGTRNCNIKKESSFSLSFFIFLVLVLFLFVERISTDTFYLISIFHMAVRSTDNRVDNNPSRIRTGIKHVFHKDVIFVTTSVEVIMGYSFLVRKKSNHYCVLTIVLSRVRWTFITLMLCFNINLQGRKLLCFMIWSFDLRPL